MSGKDREAACGRRRWLTMMTAHLTTFRASLPLRLPPRLTDISLTASAPAAPPSWLPHSRGPPPVDPHQAHSKRLLPGNTGPGSPSPQTSCLSGYEHPRGSAYWDPSVKSPHCPTAPSLRSPSSPPTARSAQLAPAPVTSPRHTHLGASCLSRPAQAPLPSPPARRGLIRAH